MFSIHLPSTLEEASGRYGVAMSWRSTLLSKYLECRSYVLSRLSLRAYENGGIYLIGTGTGRPPNPIWRSPEMMG